jgi:glycosyltransferase involved in cell wall biosynthesis
VLVIADSHNKTTLDKPINRPYIFMKIKIATIMAVYRGDNPTALAAALESIVDQRFTELVESRHYVAVDGPVPAEIAEVLSKYESNIHCLLRLKHNNGLAAALNAVIEKLEDEDFIFRMDADDISDPFRYQSQLDYLRQHPEVDILGTDIIEVITDRGVRRRVGFSSGPTDALKKLCWRVPVAHPTVCFRKKVLDRVGGYPLAGTNEDIALWFRCAQDGFKFDNIHEPLYEFTVSPNFWRRRSFKKSWSELRCYSAGIWAIHGITWKYILPLFRFALRLSPHWVSRLMYNLPLRGLEPIK